jgi:hypothetical protein
MAKKSALDAKVAEIDAEIARLTVAVERWQGMRDYLTRGAVATVTTEAAPKKRGRGKGKKGLPAGTSTAAETLGDL